MTRRVLAAGDAALLVETSGLDEIAHLAAALDEAPPAGVIEAVPAARTLLVRFAPGRTTGPRLAAALRRLDPAPARPAAAREVIVPVRYDGDDLDEVAGLLGSTPEALARRHADAAWRVAFVGFAPGFAYLVCDDPCFDVPRRTEPRTRIPAGAVALAGRYSGVYPRATPGGWQLIGTSDEPMWRPDRDPPALLTPGTAVRFVAAARPAIAAAPRAGTRAGPAALPAPPPAPPASTPRPVASACPALELTAAALPVLVQDLGRPGHAALGVGAGGAVDRAALRAANRAVGNEPGAAALEISLGPAEFVARGSVLVALAGAPREAELERAHGRAEPFSIGVAALLHDGDRLALAPPERGVRTYLAVRGGIDAPPLLGSRAADTLAGLGPAPLVAGAVVAVERPGRARDAVPLNPVPLSPGHAGHSSLPRPGDAIEVDVVLGPRDDWFTPAALRSLTVDAWRVTPASNRVGLRMDGPRALERARGGELEPEGMPAGAVQVPPAGMPIVFLADHPLTGGYPVIATVATRHLDRLGQAPPGALVRFRPVSP